jgi:hypothetical protein
MGPASIRLLPHALYGICGALILGGCLWVRDVDGLASDNGKDALDSGSSDGDTTGEGGADAGDDGALGADGEGGATGFCASLVPAPVFCDDFDGPPLTTKWPTVTAPAGAVVATQTLAFVSPPRGLGINTSGANAAFVSRSFPGSFGSVHLAFDVLVAQGSSTENTYVATLEVGNNAVALYASFDVSLLRLQERIANGGSPPTVVDHSAQPPLGKGKWRHVVIDLALTGGSPKVTMQVEGATMIANEALDPSWQPGEATLSVGPTYLQVSDPRALQFDNVVLDPH